MAREMENIRELFLYRSVRRAHRFPFELFQRTPTGRKNLSDERRSLFHNTVFCRHHQRFHETPDGWKVQGCLLCWRQPVWSLSLEKDGTACTGLRPLFYEILFRFPDVPPLAGQTGTPLCRLATVCFLLRRICIPAKFVYVRNKSKRKDWLVIVSTDTALSEEEIIRVYGKRWGIDCNIWSAILKL